MNKIGISSACYYPLETEKSLVKLGETGTKTAELFFNTTSELEPPFVKELKAIRDNYSLNIVSVHPFMSFAESYFLFSNYERRYYDILPLYEKFFEASRELGAKIFVIHGAKIPGSVDDALYCERFASLMELGKKFDITVAHENVVHYRGESPAYLQMMADNIGDDFRIVFDIKQARRAGFAYDDFLPLIKDHCCHIHISDHNDEKDCVPPFEGSFDFNTFFKKMKEIGYKGDYIIELYSWSYSDEGQIKRSLTSAENLFSSLSA